jgi:hypothetical protein
MCVHLCIFASTRIIQHDPSQLDRCKKFESILGFWLLVKLSHCEDN